VIKELETRGPGAPDSEEAAARIRILNAAMGLFMERGFAATSTLEIATRARVSKRELYALVGNKQQMLIDCFKERSKRFRVPADLPRPRDREGLAQLLVAFGAQLVREVSDPDVVGAFRLAIAEAVNAPEVGRTLDSVGRGAGRNALRGIMAAARESGLIEGDPAELENQFSRLLFGDLMVVLLLGVATRPKPREMAKRAQEAVTAFLQLHPPPKAARVTLKRSQPREAS
jgi:AcrR family transcriptional regulator